MIKIITRDRFVKCGVKLAVYVGNAKHPANNKSQQFDYTGGGVNLLPIVKKKFCFIKKMLVYVILNSLAKQKYVITL